MNKLVKGDVYLLNEYYILVFVMDEYDKYHHNPFPTCDIDNKK
jgi:hypothetical protein